MLRSQIEELNLGEIPAYPLDSFYNLNALAQLRRLVHHLKAAKIDVLHTHDFYTNIFGMVAGALARVPVRIASRRETTGMRTSAQLRAQRFAYSLAHQIVANSEAVQDRLIDEGIGPNKIAVIYNGLDVHRVAAQSDLPRAAVLHSLGVSPEMNQRCFVTIVANMRHDVKDYPMFLRAAQRVHEAVPEAAFLLAGEGELMPSLRVLAEQLGLGGATIFLGRCENISRLLGVSDVCVLSSKAEGFSNSILEYMASGRPVVATDVGGAREAIAEGETGYLVASGDDALMAERIIYLLTNPEKARAMGESGRRRVEQSFSCEAQLKRTEELYNELLHGSRADQPAPEKSATRESA